MFTVPEWAAEALGAHLAEHLGRRFGSTYAELIEVVQSAARLSIDCIGNSDALYHNVEHTMLVTLVGYDILKGRRLFVETTASDFAHLLIACLCHDIGYVRGILNGDCSEHYVMDAKGNRAHKVAAEREIDFAKPFNERTHQPNLGDDAKDADEGKDDGDGLCDKSLRLFRKEHFFGPQDKDRLKRKETELRAKSYK